MLTKFVIFSFASLREKVLFKMTSERVKTNQRCFLRGVPFVAVMPEGDAVGFYSAIKQRR
jgi:hypothetical protein